MNPFKSFNKYLRHHKWLYAAAVVFLLIMSFWNGITEWLWDKNVDADEWKSQTWIAILCVFYAIILVVRGVQRLRKYTCRLNLAASIISILVIAVYVRLRFESQFEFYSIFGSPVAWSDLLVSSFIFDVVFEPSAIKKEKSSTKTEDNSLDTEKNQVERIKEDISFILDKPVTDAYDDLMEYGKIAAHLYSNLMITDASNGAFSTGLIGEWGQGKSSMLNFLEKEIGKDDNNVLIEFNPRNASTANAIQSEFFEQFSHKVTERVLNIRIELAKYVKTLLKANSSSWIASAIYTLFPQKIITRDDINDIIKDSGLRLFVIIDDFDRLTAPEILEVLKLIDCNANFCNTYFITAFDKSYVNDVLGHYLQISKIDFTDKYFDYEYFLPVVNQANLLNYMNRVLQGLQNKGYKIGDLAETWASCGPDICDKLGTIRNLKRYMNLFLGRYFMINEEVNAHDYLYVTLLRYKDMNAYNSLLDNSFIYKGGSQSRTSNNDVRENPDLYYINENLQDTIKENSFGECTEKIIRELFPITRNAPAEEKDFYQRIQSTVFFNRYIYDFQSLLLNQRELRKMIDAESDDDATNILMTISESHQLDVKLYLIKELEDFAKTGIPFTRLITLSFAYIAKFPSDLDFIFNITDLFETPILSRIIHNKQFKTTEDYRAYWNKKLVSVGDTYPYELSHVLQLVYNAQHQFELDAIFRSKDLYAELLRLQRKVLKNAEEKDDFDDVFMASQIYALPSDVSLTPKEFAHFDEYAVKLLFDSMYKHPGSYLRYVIRMQTGGGQLQIWLDNALVDIISQYPEKMLDWIDHLNDSMAKDVVKWLNEEEKKSRVVEYEKRENPSMEQLHVILKDSYQDEDEYLVRNALDDEHSYDIEHIKFWILGNRKKSLHDDILNILNRLYEKKIYGEWIRKIKDKVEAFEAGDFVKLDKETAKAFEQKSNTILRINDIIGDTAHLEGLKEHVPIESLIPVRVNGEDDMNIYDDSPIAGSVIGRGQNKPTHKYPDYTYYLSKFKSNEEINKAILKAACRFVHEIQHVLRKEFHNEHLRLRQIS